MRVLRTSWVVGAALGFCPALASAQSQYSPQTLLTRNTPVFRGVEYDLPPQVVKGSDPAIKAAVEACKVEANREGFTVRDGQGKLLRKFADSNGKKTQRNGEDRPGTHLDQWSYYLDGFEVYRESDLDEDGTIDEVRWMNAGGTRVAQVKPLEGGRGFRVASWTRISAEEASKVLVQGLIFGDRDMVESVLATPEELQSIGAPKETIERATAARGNLAKGVGDLVAALKESGWGGQTAWSRFDGAMPRVIPAGATPGLKNEVTLYENVVIFADAGNPAANAKLAYLSAPEVVKVGECWKFIDLPHAVDPVKPAAGSLASLRADIFRSGPAGPIVDPELEKALAALTEHDKTPVPEGDGKKAAEWHVERVKLLYKVVAAAKDPADKLTYQKQAVNDLAEAVSTELYPEGMGVIDKLIGQGGKIGSYAAHRKILLEFDLDSKQPGANLLTIQNASLAKFEDFLKKFPKADEEPDALLQLATVNDFNGDEDAAARWYSRLSKDHPDTVQGKKALGALKRLASDGKPFVLVGAGVDGKEVTVESFRGRPVLVVYWSAPDAPELAKLAAVKEKLGPKGFEVVTVNLDGDKDAAAAALKEVPAGWPTIREEGGLDSRPANEMGIISTPTMILLDGQGKVANRKIRRADEVEKALERMSGPRGGANAAGLK